MTSSDKIYPIEGTPMGASNVSMPKRSGTSLKEVLIEEKERFWGKLEPDLRRFRRELRHPRTWAYLTGMALVALIVISAVTYVAFAQDLATKDRIVNAKNTGAILYDRNGEVIYATEGAHDVSYVTFGETSDYIKQATVAVEDKDFYQHGGFSLQAIVRSIYANFLNADPTKYGGSTITQQLVKNALLNPRKEFLRKFQEFVLSVEIERRYSKDEILEMYLNSVYYGSGAYGIGNATKTYFGKTVKDVTIAEAAQLAALPVAPSLLSPIDGDKDAATVRKDLVIDKMSELGYISSEERDSAKAVALKFQPRSQTLGLSPHFSLYVLEELRKEYGEDAVGRLGLRVTTSLDLGLQRFAEETVRDQVERLKANKASNGALVAIDPRSGEILAMVGSADYENDSIGGKVNISFADRQPGSAIKPIVYLKALETRNFTAATVLHDSPTDFNGYKPTDYDGLYRGDILARFALGASLNIPAVELLSKLGIDEALEMAHRLNISTLQDRDRYGLSLVLGGGEVKLLELTRAYGVIANYGNYVETTPILKVVDRSGDQIFTASPRRENLVDPQYTYIISNILADNNARAIVLGPNSILKASRSAAVKTGTTERFRDAWTVGYSPNIVVGVWVGNNDGSFMDSVAGSLGAAPIWRTFIERAWTKLGWEDFKVPAGIQRLTVCLSDGLPSKGGDGTYSEVFALGTVPTGRCGEDIRREEEEKRKQQEEATKEAEPKKEEAGVGINVATDSAVTIP